MNVDCRPRANVFIDNSHDTFGIDLNPQADEGICEAEIERAIQGQVRVVIDGPDVNGGVELVEDDVFEIGFEAEHFGFKRLPAGTAHLRDAVIDFEIALCLFCLSRAIAP